MNDKPNKAFYISTPIFYPNANLHMGHAYVVTLCDAMARYQRSLGKEAFFLTGADENSTKVVEAAKKAGKSVSEFTDEITLGFKKLFSDLEASNDIFMRTSDREVHWPGAIKLWNKLVESGDIYKKKYVGLYCVGCETFYTEKDLVNGKCPYHDTVPEKIEEENYFFRLSKYQDFLKETLSSGSMEVLPLSRRKEVLSFLENPLEDISFSRPVKGDAWGIPVPGDASQVMYVWCDALANYVSAVGYGREGKESDFAKYWPADYHVIGKDILRFHAVFWPAMLKSAGLPLPKSVFVHGMITSGGRKMSKSLGNVIDPQELIKEYGAEALRYFLLRHISTLDDGDMTPEMFKEAYNANLANGLGNLVSRVLKMHSSYFDKPYPFREEYQKIVVNNDLRKDISAYMGTFELNRALDVIWREISSLDQHIQNTKPFTVFKTEPDRAREIVSGLMYKVLGIAHALVPFLPSTSAKIFAAIEKGSVETPLFMRKD